MAFNRKPKPERQEWKLPPVLQLLRGLLGAALTAAKIAIGGIATVLILAFIIINDATDPEEEYPQNTGTAPAAPTEAPEPTKKETPTETTPPETEPAAPAVPPTEQETEPTYKQEDLELLALAIYQEAGADYCSDETRMMVGSVAMNRVEDDRYPDTIYEVLTQKSQYGRLHWTGPVWPERADRKEEAHAVARAYTIAERILQGESVLPEDVIYQAEFPQGSEVVAYQDGIYFCR